MLTNGYDGNIWAREIVLLVKHLLYKKKNLSYKPPLQKSNPDSRYL